MLDRSTPRVALLAGLVASCAALGSGCNETTRARVSFVGSTPAAGATGVAVNAPITVTFSFSIAASSVTSDSFHVAGSASGPVYGLFSQDETGRDVTFLPGREYDAGEVVTVTLTSQITSTSGAPLGPLQFSFTIAPAADPADGGGDDDDDDDDDDDPPPNEPESPTVAATVPAALAGSFPVDGVIEIRFSKPLNPFTVGAVNALVDGAVSGAVPIDLGGLLGGDTLRLTPQRPLAPGERVTVRLLRGIEDVDGGVFAGYSFEFRAASAPPPDGDPQLRTVATVGPPIDLGAVDLDGDGTPEVVYLAENASRVAILRVARDDADEPTLEPIFDLDAGEPVHAFATGDIDADGDIDIVLGLTLRAVAFLNATADAELAFEAGPERATASTVRGIAIADLDHISPVEVLLDTDRGIEILAGGFVDGVPERLGDRRMARTPLEVADVDGDGHLDLVYGDPRQQALAIRLGSPVGNGRLGDAIEVATPGDIEQVALVDLDGDGLRELLALLLGSPTASPFALVEQDAETGEYPSDDPPAAGATVLESGRFALGDLDGDGRPDIVVTAQADDRVDRFASPSDLDDLASAAATELLGALGPLTVALADFDGDGSLDVVVGAGNELRLQWTSLFDDGDPPIDPPDDPSLTLRLDDVEVRQSDEGARVRVALDSDTASEGLTIVVGFDPAVVAEPRFDIAGGALATAEWIDTRVVDGADAVTLTAIVDFLFPIVGTTIPPGDDIEVAHLVFDVPVAAPLGASDLVFSDGLGSPPLDNGVLIDGELIAPSAVAGSILVTEGPPPPPVDYEATLSVATVPGVPGDTVRVPVVTSSERTIDAFTAVIAYDSASFEVLDFDLAGSDSETFAPEMVIPTFGDGFAALTLFFDFVPPFDGNTLPVGEDLLLATLVVRVVDDGTFGLRPLVPTDGLGDPVIDNVFVEAGFAYYPELVGGGVDVQDIAPVPTFVRGDVNGDGDVDVTDSNAILDWVFGRGPFPACFDAADVDDDGRVNVTDSTRILDFTARGGPPPESPFPAPGTDPTDDALDCASPPDA